MSKERSEEDNKKIQEILNLAGTFVTAARALGKDELDDTGAKALFLAAAGIGLEYGMTPEDCIDRFKEMLKVVEHLMQTQCKDGKDCDCCKEKKDELLN